jgi:hypothetical protein
MKKFKIHVGRVEEGERLLNKKSETSLSSRFIFWAKNFLLSCAFRRELHRFFCKNKKRIRKRQFKEKSFFGSRRVILQHNTHRISDFFSVFLSLEVRIVRERYRVFICFSHNFIDFSTKTNSTKKLSINAREGKKRSATQNFQF